MGKHFSHISNRILLLRDRNMNIGNSTKEKEILKKYNYYNLINGYKDPFLYQGAGTTDHYITGTKLSELESVLQFDSNLRNIFLPYILKIEEMIKHQLVQSFYHYHQFINETTTSYAKESLHKESEYLNRKYYDLDAIYVKNNSENNGLVWSEVQTNHFPGSRQTNKTKIYDNFIISAYTTLRNQRNKNNSILSYMTDKEYVPMWVLMNVLTLGQTGRMFSIQKKEVQLDFIKSFDLNPTGIGDDLSIINTTRIIEILTIFRNTCAHSERFYNESIKIPIDDIYNNYGVKLPYYIDPDSNLRLNGNDRRKRNKSRSGIYSLIFIFYLFLSKEDFREFETKLNQEFQSLSDSLSTIDITKIYSLMGLDFDWINKIKLKYK